MTVLGKRKLVHLNKVLELKVIHRLARSSVYISHIAGRDSSPRVIFHCLPVFSNRKLERGVAKTQTDTLI